MEMPENIGQGDSLLGVVSDAAWYCVRSQPRHEHIAAAHLRRNRQLEVFSPRIRFRRSTRRGPVWVTEPLFPSYLFTRFNWKRLLPDVQHTTGVAGVVHFGALWPTVPDQVIASLRAAVDHEETRVIEEMLEVGDEVQVFSGAFHGFSGVVARLIPARQRVAVLLEFLGRQTLVEVDRALLKKSGAWRSVRFGCAPPGQMAPA